MSFMSHTTTMAWQQIILTIKVRDHSSSRILNSESAPMSIYKMILILYFSILMNGQTQRICLYFNILFLLPFLNYHGKTNFVSITRQVCSNNLKILKNKNFDSKLTNKNWYSIIFFSIFTSKNKI